MNYQNSDEGYIQSVKSVLEASHSFKHNCGPLFLLHCFETKYFSSKADGSLLLTELPLNQSYCISVFESVFVLSSFLALC